MPRFFESEERLVIDKVGECLRMAIRDMLSGGEVTRRW